MMIGDGTCMTPSKEQTLLVTKMQLNIYALRDPKRYLNSNIWDYHFQDLKMAEYIKDLLVDNLKILVKVGRPQEHVQQLTGLGMLFFTLYIKIMLKKALIFLMNGLQLIWLKIQKMRLLE